MNSKNTEKQIIGRVEKVSFPEHGISMLHARIDTGAQTSAIWVSRAMLLADGRLEVIFFDESSSLHTGEPVYFTDFSLSMVASSNGIAQQRYKVRLLVVLNNRKIRANFTLADRSTQVYPVLIGRNVLRGKFIVDVNTGTPLNKAEIKRSVKLQSLKNYKGSNI